MCIAQFVRESNAEIWAPDLACEAAPEMIADEPPVMDSFETPDGRSWVRVYLDSSALDQNGTVYAHAPRAAASRRLEPALMDA